MHRPNRWDRESLDGITKYSRVRQNREAAEEEGLDIIKNDEKVLMS